LLQLFESENQIVNHGDFSKTLIGTYPFMVSSGMLARKLSLEPKLTRRGSMLRFMIERHYGQRQIAEGFFNEPRIGGNQG
jgi:hypothetical protein